MTTPAHYAYSTTYLREHMHRISLKLVVATIYAASTIVAVGLIWGAIHFAVRAAQHYIN